RHGGQQPRTGNSAQQRETAPMPSRNGFRHPLPLLAPTPITTHLRVEPGFIHKDPLPVFDGLHLLLKRLALLLNLGAVLLLGVDRLFFKRKPMLFSTFQMETRLTSRRCSCRNFSCSSARVKSGWALSQARKCSRIAGVNCGLRPGW